MSLRLERLEIKRPSLEKESDEINKTDVLPHLVLVTLIEPAAQHGGGISPPQQDLLSDMVDELYFL